MTPERVPAAGPATRKKYPLIVETRTFWVLRNLYLTDAQKSDAATYTPGQVVQFFQNAKDARRGERFRIDGRDDAGHVIATGTDQRTIRLPLEQPGRFQVYETDRVGIAAGDMIRITVNGKTEDGNIVSNGALHKVQTITEEGEIVLEKGWRLGPAFAHFAPGYCVTSLSSQGKSPQNVLVAQGAQSFPASSLEQEYVSLSRGKRSARLYTDDKAALMERVKESSHRASATELLEGAVTGSIKPVTRAVLRQLTAQRFQRYAEQMRRVMGQEAALELISSQNPEREYPQERNRDHGRVLER